MKRPKIGDIIEIATSKGFGYAQYSHKHPTHGYMLRVFRPIFAERPQSFDLLAQSEPGFITFFPLGAAVNRNIVAIAGHAALPASAEAFPLFRTGIIDPKTGKIDLWWLWDGDTEWRAGKLSPDQYDLPLRGIINDTLLIEYIETGWAPATDRHYGRLNR